MRKTCSYCGITKDISEFGRWQRGENGYFMMCKECHKASKQRYVNKIKDMIYQYKLGHPCIECGEADPIVLDFHHRDPNAKSFKISFAVMHGSYSIFTIQEEMAKCDVLCANCHTKMHYPDPYQGVVMRKYPNGKLYPHLRAKRWFAELKQGKSCKCGESHPAALEYHHRDPKTKLFNIKEGKGKEATMAEITKCDLLCCNCHRKAENA